MKKVKYLVIAILFILAVYSIYRTANDIRSRAYQVDELAMEVRELEEENIELKEEIAEKKTRDFIKLEALRRLGLVKPNQKIILFPDEDEKLKNDEVKSEETEEIPIPNQWLNLLTSNNPLRLSF